MANYLCRWPNGDFSIVNAKTKCDAIEMLDEWGNAEQAILSRMGHRNGEFQDCGKAKTSRSDLRSLPRLESGVSASGNIGTGKSARAVAEPSIEIIVGSVVKNVHKLAATLRDRLDRRLKPVSFLLAGR